MAKLSRFLIRLDEAEISTVWAMEAKSKQFVQCENVLTWTWEKSGFGWIKIGKMDEKINTSKILKKNIIITPNRNKLIL